MNDNQKKKVLLQLLLREFALEEVVPTSAIYECSMCENLQAFKRGERFIPCDACPQPNKDQGWYRTDDLVHFVTKNLNVEFERIETYSFKMAEFIATFAGNIWFVYFHVLWFSLWIAMNTGNGLFGIHMYDPYPFPFLVLVVSLEAIFLATFILIAQNIQTQRSELRAEIDYQVNLKTEKDVAEMLSILNDIREGHLVIRDGRVSFDQTKPKHRKRM